VGLSDGMGARSQSEAPDSDQKGRQEDLPAQQNQQRSHTLMAAFDSGGGMSAPPQAESNGGSSGIVASGPAVVVLRILGHVSIGHALAPPSPDPLGLLDPPKISG